MKIIITSSKDAFRSRDLVGELERKSTVFYEDYGVDLRDIKELNSKDDKILAIDEVRIKGGYSSINKMLTNMKNVKYICGLSARYHEFDLNKAKSLGIKYCNNPDTTTKSVAQLAVMHMFMLIRNYPQTKQDDFSFYGVNNLGREYQALTAGIFGYGNIGSKIADICNKLGMEVKIWSRSEKVSKFQQVGIDDLLDQDVIFIALPTEEGTRKLFDNNFYQNLKKKNYIIDVSASDELYDKNKVIKLANDGKIAGFGFEEEKQNSEYIDFKGNIVSTPHIGWGTEESYFRLYKGWVDTILACSKGAPINVIS